MTPQTSLRGVKRRMRSRAQPPVRKHSAPLFRHCEERSDEAICLNKFEIASPLREVRNDITKGVRNDNGKRGFLFFNPFFALLRPVKAVHRREDQQQRDQRPAQLAGNAGADLQPDDRTGAQPAQQE